jgi:hypothetical protein
MYLATQIGRRKVSALSEMISDINANADISYNFNILDEKSNIVLNKNSIGILAFDSMKSRLDIAKTLCKRNIFAIIDGRMGAETLQVYSLTNTDIDIYKNTWYSDEDGDKEPCTASATPYCANIAGSIIANNIAKITSGQPLYKEIVFHFPTMTMIAKS